MHPIVLLSKLSTDVVFRDFPGGKVVGFSLRRGDRATCSGFSWRGCTAPMHEKSMLVKIPQKSNWLKRWLFEALVVFWAAAQICEGGAA